MLTSVLPGIRGSVVTALCLVLFSLAGCRDPSVTVLNDASSDVRGQKSFLTFKSLDEFYQTADRISKGSDVQQIDWDVSQGFTSLRQLHNRVVEEEYANFQREDKLYLANPKVLVEHVSSATLASVADMIKYDKVNGGVLLNLADPKLASVLNKDGMVCINKGLYQFTYDFVKCVPLLKDELRSVDLLKGIIVGDKTVKVNVSPITHSIRPSGLANARAQANRNRSCEDYQTDGGSNFKWRMIAYIDEVFNIATEYDYSRPIYDQSGGLVGYEVGSTYSYANIVLLVRTLSRGFWGDWYDRSSNLQQITANYTLSTGTSNSLNTTPGSNSTSSWYTNIYFDQQSYGGGFPFPVYATYATINAGSNFNFSWGGNYNCNCSISY